MQRAYFYFARFFNGLFYIDNVDSSLTGVGNRFSGYVTNYKATMKRLKHSRPRSYRIGKWTLHAALLGLIVAWAL
jgi:beta-hydroxylase